MNRKNRNIPPRIKRIVLERDNDRCVKCARYKNLELHHIVPAYKGGVEEEWNLITLCSICHKEAPDNPIEFFKWAITSLPPKLDESLKLTKICIGVLSYNGELLDELCSLKSSNGSANRFEDNKIFQWIDSFYRDLWKCYVSNDLKKISIFFQDCFSSAISSDIAKEKGNIYEGREDENVT